jgi:hypothetical protein
MALLRGRLGRGASIGLDGALEMRDWYAERGFVFSHRSIRYESIGAERVLASGVVSVADVSFERLAAYDRRCFPAPRERFLRAWLEQPDGLALAAVDDDIVRGFGVIRRCETGARIGPLFADDAGTAEALLDSLGAFAPDEPIFIDIPEVNAWAMSLARRRRMYEMSGHARMYLGPPPRIAESRVYGISTLEFG